MLRSRWLHKWMGLARTRKDRRRLAARSRKPVRLRLESLEDRITPSYDVLTFSTAAGSVGSFSVAPNQPSEAIAVQLRDNNGNPVNVTSNLTVQLSSNSSTGQFLDQTGKPLANSSLVIPTGSSFALFEYEDSQAAGKVALTGQSYNPAAFGGVYVNVQGRLTFTTPTQTIAPGEASQPITIQLQDANGNAVKSASDTTITLSSTSKTGAFLDTSGNPLSSLTIAAGSDSASFEYEDSQAGSVTLSANGGVGDFVSQQENIQYSLGFTTPVQVIPSGQPSGTITVQLQDSSGKALTAASTVTIDLSSTSGGEFLDTTGKPLTGNSLIIAAGDNSASFEYEQSGFGVSPPTITATIPTSSGSVAPSAKQQIYVGSSAITTPAQTLTSGKASQPITLQLASAATSALTINLSSTSSTGTFLDTSGNPVSSIPIAAGSNSASFEYQDSTTGLPTITAESSNFTVSAQQQENVGVSLNFTTAPQTIPQDQKSQPITIQLQDSNGNPFTAPSAIVVQLGGGEFLNTAGSFINSVTIAAGSNSASFEYEPFNSGTQTVTATAPIESGGLSLTATQQETVTSSSLSSQLAFVSPVQTLTAGQPPQPITVQLQNQGAAVPATSAVTIDLSSSSSTGTFLDTSGNPLTGNSISIAAGASTASFEYEDSQEWFPTLTAKVSGSSQQSTQTENIGGVSLAFATPPQSLTAGTPSGTITVQLQDSNGKAVTAPSAVVVNLGGLGKFLDLSGNPLTSNSVTIAAGSSSASFEYESSVGGKATLTAEAALGIGLPSSATQQETITGPYGVQFANSAGLAEPFGQFIALDQPSKPITVQLVDASGNPATAATAVTVELSSTSSGSTFLDTSGNPSGSGLIIPAGSSSASFEYEDSQTGFPTLMASENGITSAPLQENVGVSLVFTTPPQTLATGQTSQPVTVQLQDGSGNPFAAPVNETFFPSGTGFQFLDTSGNPLPTNPTGGQPMLAIAQGANSASFEFKSAAGGTPTLSVTGAAETESFLESGLPGLSASQKETIQGLSSLAFTTGAQTLAAGQMSQLVTLQLQDNNGNPANAPSGGLTINLSGGSSLLGAPSSSSSMKFFDANGNPLPTNASGAASLTMPAGSSTVSFEFESNIASTVFSLLGLTESSTAITASASTATSSNLFSQQQIETIQAGPASSAAFTTGAQSLLAGVPSADITVQLQDKYGNAVTAGSGGLTLNLSSSSSSGNFLSNSGNPLANSSITIPQGASSATFAYEDSQAGTPTLTATAGGVSGKQQETVVSASNQIHVTNTKDSGDGSLRAALTAADNNPSSTIVFDSGVTGTIDLLSELPNITANTIIVGPGANSLTVERSSSATGTFGGFAVGIPPTTVLGFGGVTVPPPEPIVTISGLTLANFDGTGISNYGTLTLSQVEVSGTQPQSQAPSNPFSFALPASSGGVSNQLGSLTILDSTIANNSVAGINSEGPLTVLNSTITGNTGGGINIASVGSILNGGLGGGADYIASSTISGNTAAPPTTGLFGTGTTSAGGITTNVTPLLASLGGQVTLYDTIVAGNLGSSGGPPDVQGSFNSLGYNLIGAADKNSSGFVSTDLVGTTTSPIDPKLASLQTNGGPTLTMALLPGSPAIAAGNNSNAPATDQLGNSRPATGAIDIGAVQLTASSNTISLLPTTLPVATVGVAYNQSITASGGNGTLSLSTNPASVSLPAGLSLRISGSTLTISGTPTAGGSVRFSVAAADTSGNTATQSYTLTVNSVSTTITLSPGAGALPSATVGTFYNQSITASGGNGTLSLSTNPASVSLPAGLSLRISGSTLTISGTPTASGSARFSVAATDANGDTATQNYTLTVNATAPPPQQPPPAPPAPPVLTVPPLLSLFDSLLGGVETINANGTETLTDSFFGFPLLVSTFDHSGKLQSVDLFGFLDITFLFELL